MYRKSLKKKYVRIVPFKCVIKRGCDYCEDMVMVSKKNGQMTHGCIHMQCPYRELDNFNTYDEYLSKTDFHYFLVVRKK